MIIVNAGTKKAESLLRSTNYKEGIYLEDVYKTCSSSKKQAWTDCYNKYYNERLNRENEDITCCNFRITSYNTNFFTVAWETELDGQPARHIETAYNTYIVLK